jgi:hypothetical protein
VGKSRTANVKFFGAVVFFVGEFGTMRLPNIISHPDSRSRAMLSVASLAVASAILLGQAEETVSNYEHMKCYDQLVGTWCYDGPLLEDTPIAKKGSDFLAHMSFTWILNKSAIEVTWKVEYEGGVEVTGKSLHGWNPAEDHIVTGGMDSLGALHLGEVSHDCEKKLWTLKLKGVAPSGDSTSTTITNTLPNPNTLVWQATERQGGDLTGPSPKYEFKRCKCENDDDDDHNDDGDDEDDD